MTIDLDAAAAGIKTALTTIAALKGRVWDHVPERVTAPCAIVALGEGTWDTFNDAEDVTFSVLLLASLADARNAQQRLRAFLAASGADSVKAAIEADDSLGSTVSSVSVERWAQPDGYEIGGVSFLGVELTVSIFG